MSIEDQTAAAFDADVADDDVIDNAAEQEVSLEEAWQAALNTVVTIAWSKTSGKQNNDWANTTGPLAAFINAFIAEFPESPTKDNGAYLQGALALNEKGKAYRGGKNMISASLFALDYDDGTTAETIEGGMRRLGVGGFIANTYSSDPNKVLKYRAGCPVKEPFDFGHGTPENEWRRALWPIVRRLVVADIGGKADKATDDPARMFFRSQRPIGSDPNNFALTEVVGRALDLAPYIAKAMEMLPREAFDKRFEKYVPDPDKPTVVLKTAGLRDKLRKQGPYIALGELVLAYDLAKQGGDGWMNGDCPFGDEHTEGGPGGASFIDAGGKYPCVAKCFHKHDKRGGLSTYEIIDELLTKNKLDVSCLDDYIDWPSYWADHPEEEAAVDAEEAAAGAEDETADAAALTTRVKALARDDDAERALIMAEMAKMPKGVAADRLVADIVRITGAGKRAVADELRAAREVRDERIAALVAVARDKREKAEKAEKAAKARRVHEQKKNNDDEIVRKTQITVVPDHSEMVDMVLAVLQQANDLDPKLFVDGTGKTVRLVPVHGRPRFPAFGTSAQWGSELSKRMHFLREGDDGSVYDVPPPPTIKETFSGYSAADFGFRDLEDVIVTPVADRHGSINTNAGYDKVTKTWLSPIAKYKDVTDKPTDEQVAAAVAILIESIRDIPFSDLWGGTDWTPIYLKDEGDKIRRDSGGHKVVNFERGKCSRANFLAMVLQPFLYNVLEEWDEEQGKLGGAKLPAYFIDKTVPGSGASLIADVASYIADGVAAGTQGWTLDEDEQGKIITTALYNRRRILFLDNLKVPFGGPHIEAMLTSGRHKGRLLGGNEEFSGKVRMVTAFAGNNTSMTDDMQRRVVPIRIDRQTSKPGDLANTAGYYKHPQMTEWLVKNRAELVWAAHVLIRNWVSKNKPEGAVTLASFERWSKVMGGILKAAKIEGFLGNLAAFKGVHDEAADHNGPVMEMLIQKMVESTKGLENAANGPAWTKQRGGEYESAFFTLTDALNWLAPTPYGKHAREWVVEGVGIKLANVDDETIRLAFGKYLTARFSAPVQIGEHMYSIKPSRKESGETKLRGKRIVRTDAK